MKIPSNDEWVKTQFGECELGNSFRTRRLQKVASQMLSAPEQSLPKQNSLWADLKAAYRLFNGDGVTFDSVAEQHWKQTRNTKPGRYLFISDTTDINHFSHKATTGLGMLGDGIGRGMQLHHCLVFNDDDQLIEGSAGALIHYRSETPKEETRMQRLRRQRESGLWGDLVEEIGSAPQGSQWIHVFDRGGDNFEAMCKTKLTGCDWVIRGCKLNRKIIDKNSDRVQLGDAIDEACLLGGYQLSLRSRPGVKARTAKIEVSTMQVTLPRPHHHSDWVKNCGINEIPTNVVIVQEVDVPPSVTPIRWVLLTSLPVVTFNDAWQVIEDYENRWLIEEYHKALKQGCSVEKHALRTADRLEPLIGLLSIIGIRLFQMKLIGRSQPKAKAATHVPASWLKCLKLVRPKLKTTGMTVYTFFREVAKLGGFLGRKHDGEPGWETTWHGYQKLQSLLDGMALAGAT